MVCPLSSISETLLLIINCTCTGAYLEVDTNQGTWWALGPTISRGVWGHAPQKILNFMGALRCFLVHFGAGVLTGITNTTQKKEDYRNSIELSGKTES